MKNLKLTLLLLLPLTQALGQIFVKNNCYIYNKGTFIYSGKEVNLENNSNIFLRREGQFLQGRTGASQNTGLGKLSVFQEGTVNNFAYNYWCSPVGNPSNFIGNDDFGITLLNVPITTTTSNPVSITTTSYNGTSSTGSLSIASYWIWRFLSSNNYSQWIQSAALTNISAGQGFSMKGVSGSDSTNPGEILPNNTGNAQRYDFRGKPNDGTITINVANGASTLTGNPYPSAIDLNLFLTDPSNNAIDGTALFWEHDKSVNTHNIAQYRGGYGIYNGTTSIYTPATFYTYDLAGNQGSVFSNPNTIYKRRFAPIGQGFMVRGIANSSVQMKNSYRVFLQESISNNSQFEKMSNYNNNNYDSIPNLAGIDYTTISKNPAPHLVLNVSLSNQAVRQLAIGFLPSAIDNVDKADSKFPEELQQIQTDAYLYLNGEPYVHSVTSFDINKRFSIGFKNSTSNNINYTIKVNEIFDLNIPNVFLFDALNNTYYDIKNNFHEVILAPGEHNNRFEITFTDQQLQIQDMTFNSIAVAQNNQSQLLHISNPKMIELLSVSILDINGKIIFNQKNLSNKELYQFPTSNFSEGTYLVKIETKDNLNQVSKIIISNSN